MIRGRRCGRIERGGVVIGKWAQRRGVGLVGGCEGSCAVDIVLGHNIRACEVDVDAAVAWAHATEAEEPAHHKSYDGDPTESATENGPKAGCLLGTRLTIASAGVVIAGWGTRRDADGDIWHTAHRVGQQRKK